MLNLVHSLILFIIIFLWVCLKLYLRKMRNFIFKTKNQISIKMSFKGQIKIKITVGMNISNFMDAWTPINNFFNNFVRYIFIFRFIDYMVYAYKKI